MKIHLFYPHSWKRMLIFMLKVLFPQHIGNIILLASGFHWYCREFYCYIFILFSCPVAVKFSSFLAIRSTICYFWCSTIPVVMSECGFLHVYSVGIWHASIPCASMFLSVLGSFQPNIEFIYCMASVIASPSYCDSSCLYD